MIKNKRGLSAIITTLLIVMLVLVAVGIVWVVVSRVIRTTSEGLEIGAKCLSVEVRATAVNCDTPTACVVTLDRTGAGNDVISGVKLVFRDSTGAAGGDNPVDVSGNIEKLVGKILTGADAVDSGLANPEKIEVTVYFEDASGNEQLCDQTTEFTF